MTILAVLAGVVLYAYITRWLAHGMARWWTDDFTGLTLTRGNYLSMWATAALPLVGQLVALALTLSGWADRAEQHPVRDWIKTEIDKV